MKDKILELRAEGKTYNEICEILGCSKSTVSYHCGEGQKEKQRRRMQKSRKDNVMLRKTESFKRPSASFRKRRPETETDSKTLLRYKVNAFKDKRRSDGESFTYHDVQDVFGEVTRCYLTGREIDLREPKTYQFDHIVPASRGGDNSLTNLGIACSEANRAKSDMTVDEFVALCKDVLEYHGYVVQEPKEQTASHLGSLQTE